LLDDHISPKVAQALRESDPQTLVTSLQEWEEGAHLGASDEVLLEQAYQQSLTLVTYDLRTLAPLLKRWGEQGRSHGGVILVDVQTVAPSDIGELARALVSLRREQGEQAWTDRIIYLRRA
jgi:hypothetical protein